MLARADWAFSPSSKVDLIVQKTMMEECCVRSCEPDEAYCEAENVLEFYWKKGILVVLCV